MYAQSLHAGGTGNLVPLDRDHPGFRDPAYRKRRDEIARIALAYKTGQPVPRAHYAAQEHAVWAEVWRHLGPLHEEFACREYLESSRDLALDRRRIPQLADLNPRLREAAGFEMEPVAGLIAAGTFLGFLGKKVFLATQYIRHHSVPLYTPEPDVVHELIGHAATLVHPRLARLNQAMGQAAGRADPGRIPLLERVYWHTLEFGALQEEGRLKAFGAGLLSSFGEIQRFHREARLLDWDLDRMAATPYDPTAYQPRIFVAPSFDRMVSDLLAWIGSRDWAAPNS